MLDETTELEVIEAEGLDSITEDTEQTFYDVVLTSPLAKPLNPQINGDLLTIEGPFRRKKYPLNSKEYKEDIGTNMLMVELYQNNYKDFQYDAVLFDTQQRPDAVLIEDGHVLNIHEHKHRSINTTTEGEFDKTLDNAESQCKSYNKLFAINKTKEYTSKEWRVTGKTMLTIMIFDAEYVSKNPETISKYYNTLDKISNPYRVFKETGIFIYSVNNQFTNNEHITSERKAGIVESLSYRIDDDEYCPTASARAMDLRGLAESCGYASGINNTRTIPSLADKRFSGFVTNFIDTVLIGFKKGRTNIFHNSSGSVNLATIIDQHMIVRDKDDLTRDSFIAGTSLLICNGQSRVYSLTVLRSVLLDILNDREKIAYDHIKEVDFAKFPKELSRIKSKFIEKADEKGYKLKDGPLKTLKALISFVENCSFPVLIGRDFVNEEEAMEFIKTLNISHPQEFNDLMIADYTEEKHKLVDLANDTKNPDNGLNYTLKFPGVRLDHYTEENTNLLNGYNLIYFKWSGETMIKKLEKKENFWAVAREAKAHGSNLQDHDKNPLWHGIYGERVQVTNADIKAIEAEIKGKKSILDSNAPKESKDIIKKEVDVLNAKLKDAKNNSTEISFKNKSDLINGLLYYTRLKNVIYDLHFNDNRDTTYLKFIKDGHLGSENSSTADKLVGVVESFIIARDLEFNDETWSTENLKEEVMRVAEVCNEQFEKYSFEGATAFTFVAGLSSKTQKYLSTDDGVVNYSKDIIAETLEMFKAKSED